MALHPNQLWLYYKQVVVSGRRDADNVFDFMHHDDRARGLRKSWLEPLERLVLADQPEFFELPGTAEQVHWAIHDAPPNIQDAFFWVCVWLYEDVRRYLETVETPNPNNLIMFMNHRDFLPRLCMDMFNGNSANPDINAFVRDIRTEYVTTMGVKTGFGNQSFGALEAPPRPALTT